MEQLHSEEQTQPTPTASRANSPLRIAIFILGIVALFFGGYYYGQMQSKKVTQKSEKSITKAGNPEKAIGTDTDEWKLYINEVYNYSIRYPSDWTVREFPDSKTGASFRPNNKPNDYQYEYISINKSGRIMSDELPNPTFEEYVKIAGKEIQNYNSLSTIKKIETQSGIVGYTTTWKVSPLSSMGRSSAKEGESLPRTYFEIPGDNTATIQVEITNDEYRAIYDQMISTFTIKKRETKKKSEDPNLKVYRSSKNGISFSYLEKQNSQEFMVTESGNKICLSYKLNDSECAAGQSVEVFEKGKSETLKVAIERIFLNGKDLNRCIVSISDPNNYPATFVKGEIIFPKSEDVDMEKMAADTEYCSSDYSQTNGIRYFLEDKLHPTQFLFFSIGQYGISSENNKPWQETTTFE